MKKNDFILVLVLLLISAFFGIFYTLNLSPGNYVTVNVNGEQIGSYPLDRDTVVEIRTENLFSPAA